VGKQELHAVAKDVTKVDVDRARGPVIVDVGIEIHTGIEKHLQGGEARLMYRKSLVCDDRVVNEPGEINRADGHAAHIRVAQDIVEVICGIAPGNDRLEHVEPSRNAGVIFALFLENHMCDLVGVEFFAFREGTGRTAPDFADDRAEMVSDDDLPEFFVTGAEGVQVVVVEEVAEGAVPDIVREGRHAEKFFDIICRRNLSDRFLEKWIEMPSKAACHMHRTKRVDEAGMFCRGVDPSSALELVDVAEALDPGGVDQVFFRSFVRICCGEGYGEGDVLVNGIGDQR